MTIKRYSTFSKAPALLDPLPSDCLVSYLGHSLGGVLPPCRGTIGVFYRPGRLGHRTLVGGSLTPMQRYNQCILQTRSTRPQGHSLEGVLPPCRGTIGVFYRPGRLGHRTLVGGSLTPMQRYNRCILQTRSTRPQDTRWRESYPHAEVQSVYSTDQVD